MAYKGINPWTAETVLYADFQSWSDTHHQLMLSSSAFQQWRQLSIAERATYMHRLAEVLRKHCQRIANTITVVMG